MITLFGIPNCDSCRDARRWLDKNSVAYQLHDLRADGLELIDVHRWADRVGWKMLLNTRSKTWRTIPQAERDNIDSGRALTLMYQEPTLIKRPVLEAGNVVLVGFSADEYAANV